MYVNSVGSGRDLFVNRPKQNNSLASVPYLKNTNSVDTVSFTGKIKPVVVNKFKVLIGQDPFAAKLAVKMPESDEERIALLEILEHRVKLDRFVRLNAEKWGISIKLAEAERLAEEAPNSPEYHEVMRWLKNKGNLDSVVATLNKQIEQEAKRNKPAIEFFEELSKLEDEYLAKKIVKEQQIEKFWYRVTKENINADGRFSTSELIEIVKSGKVPPKAGETVAAAPRIASRKDLLAVIKSEYRQLLREETNVYDLNKNHTASAKDAQKRLKEKYASQIARTEVADSRLEDIFRYIEREFNAQIDNIMDIDIYPIGEHWNQMLEVESKLRSLRREVAQLIARVSTSPSDLEANAILTKKLAEMESVKKLWILGMKKSVHYEAVNREMMEKAGKLKPYDYLTGENKVIKLHKEALEICEKNNDELPEEMWVKILS